MNEFQLMKCSDCYEILGFRRISDEDGVTEYCHDCGLKRIGDKDVDEWTYGKGWHLWDKKT